MTETTGYLMLTTDVELDIPTDVAVCPYCSRPLYATFEVWTEVDGWWQADEITLECTGEDGLAKDLVDDWHDWHSQMPYVNWLPLEGKVLDWVNQRYRFRCGDTDG